MSGRLKKNTLRPVILGLAAFVLLLVITEYVVYQQYLRTKDNDRELLDNELAVVKERLHGILINDMMAANTLAAIYGESSFLNYDSLALRMIASGKYVNAVQLTKNGVIKYVYPAGYQSSIDVKAAADSIRYAEEREALKKGGIYFAGPRPMRADGDAILGRVAVDMNSEGGWFVAVVTRMSTIDSALSAHLRSQRFAYWLRKTDGSDTAVHLLTNARPHAGSETASVEIPEGNWILTVAHTAPRSFFNIYLLASFAMLISLLAGVVVYFRAVEGVHLEQAVQKATHDLGERVKELSAIYMTNEALKDARRSEAEILQDIVNILPSGWQYPEICAAKIVFGDDVYTTANYKETPYALRAPVDLTDWRDGYIEVCYLEATKPEAEGPFLKEERDLINTIAETIEVYFNKEFHREALTRSEANLRSIIESSQVGFMLCDREFNIIATNAVMVTSYEELTGRTLHVGDNFVDALLPEKKEMVQATMNKVVHSGQSIEYETSYLVDGVTTYATVNLAPVTEGDKIIGLCMAAYDITARKEMELERQRVIDELTKRNKALEDFTHVVSHHVRGPLSTILGLTNVLEHAEEQERGMIVKGIVQSSHELDGVLKELNEILTAERG